MDQIIADLRSPIFWVMTVFAGTIIGVLANYATRIIDWGWQFGECMVARGFSAKIGETN